MSSTGFGINYKADSPNWPADVAYFRANGITKIRPNLSSLPTPWVVGSSASGGYAFWRNLAAFLKAQGFFVNWGPSSLNGITTGTLTATNWTQYHDSVVAEATYLQAQGIFLDVFELGNEMDQAVDGATITHAQFVTNMGVLATDVRAVYPSVSKITYSCYDYNGTTYNDWISAGLGGLDYICVHPYADVANSGRGWVYNGFPPIAKMVKAFPGRVFVSEFGVAASDASLLSMPTYIKVAAMRDIYAYMKTLGVPIAEVYSFVGYLNGDNQFAMQRTDGSYIAEWNVLTQDGKRTSTITY